MAAPAVALARDAQGVAMAWSVPNAAGIARIHVARLDRFGRLGAIRELPVAFNSDTQGFYPSLSRRAGGDGFLVAWADIPIRRARAAYALLDASLASSAPVLLPGVTIPTAPLARTGEAMWVTSNGRFWQIETDGSARGPFDAFWPASDMTATAAGPRMISGWRNLNEGSCGGTHCKPNPLPWAGSCNCVKYDLRLRLLVPPDVARTTILEFETEAHPAIAHDGDKLLVAWFRGAQKTGGEVVLSSIDSAQGSSFAGAVAVPRVLGRFWIDAGQTRPDIAVTEQGTFVVWRTSSLFGEYDIAGALVRRDGTVEELTIAGSEADERDPSVLALENGEVLVAWRKIEGKQSRIAWRVIGSQARRRAVR